MRCAAESEWSGGYFRRGSSYTGAQVERNARGMGRQQFEPDEFSHFDKLYQRGEWRISQPCLTWRWHAGVPAATFKSDRVHHQNLYLYCPGSWSAPLALSMPVLWNEPARRNE